MSSDYQQPQHPPPPYQHPGPYPGHGPQPYPYPGPPQHGAQQPGMAPPAAYPAPGHPAPPRPGHGHPGGPGRGRGRGAAIAIVAVVAVAAIGVAGFLVFGGGGGDDDPLGGVTLARNDSLDLSRVTFPDARALGYDEGPEAACAGVAEVMLARGYEFESAENDDGGIDCWYSTPAAASFEEGTTYLRANVFMASGTQAQDVYASMTSAIASHQDVTEEERAEREEMGVEEMRWSPLYEFPVGEEGWIVHNENATRGDGTSAFRKGDTTFYVTAFGWTEKGDQDEALPEQVTLREITDIVTALGGGEAGDPQIGESAAQEYPGGLPDLGEPLPPAEGTGEERCAGLTALTTEEMVLAPQAEVTDVTAGITSLECAYEPDESIYAMDNVAMRHVRVSVEDYAMSEADYASGALGRHLRYLMEESYTEEEGASPLYALPAGISGYVVTREDEYGSSFLDAGYVVGTSYVNVTISGSFSGEGFDTRALTEEELIEDLTTVLTSMNG
ncbi:hypothetical protein ACTWP5_01235 [Streptomyces sp. 4N509B]|uniref:hypothetical protein n=1 Tax=Streptomyces sp. 4N509B TaxID=3457413 RepID=UPI003FD41AF1